MRHQSCFWPRPRLFNFEHEQFHAAEYKTLRDEIAATIEETRRLERYCATACGLIWVWAFDHGVSGAAAAAAGVAVLIASLGFLRALTLNRSIDWVASYLLTIEDVYASVRLLGWEHHIRFSRATREQPKYKHEHKSLKWSSVLFWIALVSVAIVIEIILIFLIPRLSRL